MKASTVSKSSSERLPLSTSIKDHSKLASLLLYLWIMSFTHTGVICDGQTVFA